MGCLSGGYDSTLISVQGHEGDLTPAVSVYPNPCDDVLNVAFTLQKPSKVCITLNDITGRILFTETREQVSSGNHVFQVSRGMHAERTGGPGVCIVTVKTDEGIKHMKVVFR